MLSINSVSGLKSSEMYKCVKLFFLLVLVGAEAQDPRKRYNSYPYSLDELELNKNDDVPCGVGTCMKRSSGQDEMGPFWANRGKKDPTYIREPLYAPEPYWLLLKKEESDEPFFTSRGKREWKGDKYLNNVKLRHSREYMDNVDSPFLAIKGNKLKVKNYKYKL